MTKKTIFYITSGVIAILLLIGLILGTIYDLQISKTLSSLEVGNYYSTNKFAIIGESVGEDILYLLLDISFAIVFCYLIKKPLKNKYLNYATLILSFIIGGIIIFYGLNKTLNYFTLHQLISFGLFLQTVWGKVCIVGSSILIHVVIFLLISLIKEENLKELFGWAVAVILISLVTNAIVQGSKLIFDRTRFRAMIYEGQTNFENFTPWYVINTNKFASTSQYYGDYFESFPSGHTCAAASSFLLLLLPCFYKKSNNYGFKTFAIVFSVLYTGAVALSRIIAGAHFFTDVYISILVNLVVIFIAKVFIIDKYLINKKYSKISFSALKNKDESSKNSFEQASLTKNEEEDKLINEDNNVDNDL